MLKTIKKPNGFMYCRLIIYTYLLDTKKGINVKKEFPLRKELTLNDKKGSVVISNNKEEAKFLQTKLIQRNYVQSARPVEYHNYILFQR